MTSDSAEKAELLTTAERWRLHAAAALDAQAEEVIQRAVNGEDTRVVQVVESILAERIEQVRAGETRLVDRVFDMTEWYCADEHDWSGHENLRGRLHSAFVHRLGVRVPPGEAGPS